MIRCDRDPRLVGHNRIADVPSPFLRLCLNRGIHVDICPPHQGAAKPYVERYNRSYQEACVYKDWPTTVAEAQACTDHFRTWSIHDRPHPGTVCQNQPPAVVFPMLPPLRPVPEVVDAASWL